MGSEVKALREGRANIAESYAKAEGDEVWLVNAHIPEYKQAGQFNHEPRRPRKLLLKKREVAKLIGASEREGMTLVPLKVYFNNRGIAKLELASARARSITTNGKPKRSATGIGRKPVCYVKKDDSR